MKIRSIMAALLALCMMIVCAGVASAESDKVQVTIWHTFTEDQEATLQALADGFNESQDEYEVIVESQA